MLSGGQSHSWFASNNLKNLKLKFGKQKSLGKESKGGLYEHNAEIMPL